MAIARWKDLCLDASDAHRLARFWGTILGLEVDLHDDGDVLEAVPGLPFASVDFGPVPEPKSAKNRVHWDLTCDDVAALVEGGGHGARRADRRHALARPRGPGGQRALRSARG